METLVVSKLKEDAILPTRKNPTDAGLDIYSIGNYFIKPNTYKVIRTGITIEIPENYMILIKPKSRNDYLIGAGVIDSGYQGEILVKVFNPLDYMMTIAKGQAFAQLIILFCATPVVKEVSSEEIHKKKSDRAESGGIKITLRSNMNLIDASEYLDDDIYFEYGDGIVDWWKEDDE